VFGLGSAIRFDKKETGRLIRREIHANFYN